MGCSRLHLNFSNDLSVHSSSKLYPFVFIHLILSCFSYWPRKPLSSQSWYLGISSSISQNFSIYNAKINNKKLCKINWASPPCLHKTTFPGLESILGHFSWTLPVCHAPLGKGTPELGIGLSLLSPHCHSHGKYTLHPHPTTAKGSACPHSW